VESKYDFGRLLGSGKFARVIEGLNKKKGDRVAIKIIDKTLSTSEDFKREVLIMKKFLNILMWYILLRYLKTYRIIIL